ncbi:hypothetical protein SCWH03_57810 [Streptomyces pacificus]|uniref:Uncharacterized protein n=1 Tax=Streptomyces pacificus TaxID=2705029 RepID=A0A6A0B478_9ACTN|nr:hypothetical protein SCWH03_57810 [Streptomyces pacificus]
MDQLKWYLPRVACPVPVGPPRCGYAFDCGPEGRSVRRIAVDQGGVIPWSARPPCVPPYRPQLRRPVRRRPTRPTTARRARLPLYRDMPSGSARAPAPPGADPGLMRAHTAVLRPTGDLHAARVRKRSEGPVL